MLSRALPVTAANDACAALSTELSTVEPAQLSPSVLACIGYGPSRAAHDDPRYVHVPLPLLGGPGHELWHSGRAVSWDRDGAIGFAHDGEVMMGQMTLLECELEPVAGASFQAYARLIAFLERHGYPALLRCWNYLQDINRGDADAERYKQFCLGRYQALSESDAFQRQLPAGTAIGMNDSGLVIYFLAARRPGHQIENPRQTPAFQYPRQYGPRSPSFSRAVMRFGSESLLMVSGTASVIGHATRHPHDMAAQLDETLANLQALLQHAAATHLQRDAAAWTAQTLKLYLRDPADYPAARARLEQALGAQAPVTYLAGAICRRDLEVEIEGVFAAEGA